MITTEWEKFNFGSRHLVRVCYNIALL